MMNNKIRLVAGRTGQEYNLRKKRKGAFWEDRYHATAIEDVRCLSYIDLNMVRNGVVTHPSQWQYGGYIEIQNPRKKCVLIAYEKLARLAGFKSYELFRKTHKGKFKLFSVIKLFRLYTLFCHARMTLSGIQNCRHRWIPA
ncbi:MAG: hypothetical protein MRK01_00815 [Candidatus Scalindua sp.]|nr:hypothetical protein [Candidatus Scalindua sp.]MDR4503316.1 hypothetical protein [Candidatus Scalindua sp.]